MSAGLSTTIEVVFTPHVNADIVTCLPLLAETGPIDIPLECYCRKAIVKGDKTMIDFGSVIYGEEGKVKLVLTNSGALPVGYEIRSKNDRKLPVTKPIRLAPLQLAENLLKQQEASVSEVKGEGSVVTIVEKKEEAKGGIEAKVEEKKEEPAKDEAKKEEAKKTEQKKEEAKKVEVKKEAKAAEGKKAEEAWALGLLQKTSDLNQHAAPVKEEVKELVSPRDTDFPGSDFLAQVDFSRSGVLIFALTAIENRRLQHVYNHVYFHSYCARRPRSSAACQVRQRQIFAFLHD